jgi:two-component system, chemotaxis family, response regulator Rcp1
LFDPIAMAEFGTFHVLLVEDSHTEAQFFETALKEASARARLYWVGTGREGIDFLHQRGRFEGVGAVRIVVLDLQLASESGLEVLREIKSDPKLKRTPVVMLTSSAAQKDIDDAYSLGANAYLRKPMTLPAYTEALRIFAQHWLDLVQSPSPPPDQPQKD